MKSSKVRLAVEQLESRLVPTVSAVFNSGILTVTGDAADNNIVVGADSNGNLQVTEQGNTVLIRTVVGHATLAETIQIVVDGKAGNDRITTSNTLNTLVNGVLVSSPDAVLLGGAGNDTLTAGHGGIVGGLAGVVNGVVVGPVVGNCYLDGGAGNDTLVSGFGNDIIKGGAGDDNYLWPPGTLTDVWDGGEGNDTVTILGNDTFQGQPASDQFVLSAMGERVLFQRVNLVQFTVDIGSTEKIVLKPGAGDDAVTINDLTGVRSLRQVTVEGGQGNDWIDGSGQLNSRIQLILRGNEGNDVLLGGAGNDLLDGGEGDDQLAGNDGADVLLGGLGNDLLQGGGGKDLLLGGAGDDVLRGGSGNDALFGGEGTDDLDGEGGKDLLDGGNDLSADVVRGGKGADVFLRHQQQLVPDFNPAEGDLSLNI